MSLLHKIKNSLPFLGHQWERKRTYDLAGPRPSPEVIVKECVECGMIKDECRRWFDPNPQYFEEDTRESARITDPDQIAACGGR